MIRSPASSQRLNQQTSCGATVDFFNKIGPDPPFAAAQQDARNGRRSGRSADVRDAPQSRLLETICCTRCRDSPNSSAIARYVTCAFTASTIAMSRGVPLAMARRIEASDSAVRSFCWRRRAASNARTHGFSSTDSVPLQVSCPKQVTPARSQVATSHFPLAKSRRARGNGTASIMCYNFGRS
jgi:hypothetical protein